MTSRGFASPFRVVLIALAVILSFSAVGARLTQLHVLDREDLMRHVDRARRDIVVQNARRGDILDARGDVFATSRSVIILGVDPQVLRDEDHPKWPELARLLNLPYPDVERALSTRTRPRPPNDVLSEDRLIRWTRLSDSVEESTYAQILELGIRGVYGNRTYRRAYPKNTLAAHLIGFVNREGAPSGGIEAFADFYLRGQDGWRELERDGLRREIARFRNREVPPSDGFNVVLSLDAVIQHMVDSELAELAARFKPEKAVIIVSDAQTGFILGLGNYPTFDLNAFGSTPLDHQRNLAAADLFEPGSTFKIVPAASALNERLVTPNTRFDCALETIMHQGRERRLMRDDYRYPGPLSVAEIIAKSSNSGAAQMAMRLGDQRFYDYARAFGFGERSGFPLGREEPGLLAAPARWSGSDITRIPAGYTIAATPLQIHYAMGVIASGGRLFRPQIVREIQDPSGETIYRFSPALRREVISPETASQMAAMLQKVASPLGTARQAAIPGFEIAGKTGTAQKLIEGRYSRRNHVGSFVGFFPASAPRVVITVIVDDARPPNGGTAYGGVVAVPSFKRISEQLIQYLDIKPAVETPRPQQFAAQGSRR